MNVYLSDTTNWPKSWKRPDKYLTLHLRARFYGEKDDDILDTRILKCPQVHRKLVEPKPTVLLTLEHEKYSPTEDSPLIYPTVNGFIEDSIFELFSSGDDFKAVNKKFLKDVKYIQKIVLKQGTNKVTVHLFCLGERIDFGVFGVWKRKLEKSLRGKSNLFEVKIYIFTDEPVGNRTLCGGLIVFNLSRDPSTTCSVYQKLKYMFVRNHSTECTGPCRLITTYGRIIYKSGGSVKRSKSDDRLLCKICLDREVKVIYLPCKHLIVCEKCHSELQRGNCSLCRQRVLSSHEVFF